MEGLRISHYRILRRLGSGGMGEVYAAEDERLRRNVAIKFISHDKAADEKARQRFEREARAASALNHPNICTIFEVNEHEGQPFLVMELLDGQDLRQICAAGPVEISSLLKWSVEITDALDAAHARGIIHRDIKPGNVFVTSRGDVKVLDFGLVKLLQPENVECSETVSFAATAGGSVIGTIAYMSPEQARGEALDLRTDLFSAGTVLYEMASGKRAFDGPTPAVIFNSILTASPTPISRIRGDVPPRLEEIIDKALQKDRRARYQNAAEITAHLKGLQRELESGTLGATALSRAAREKRSTLWVGAALTLVILLGGLGWLLKRPKAQSPQLLSHRTTVAVLPFQNTSADNHLDYLNTALPDEVITTLSYAPTLSVRPFSMSQRFAAQNSDPLQAGQQLKVTDVVTGHFLLRGDHIGVTLEAMNVARGEVIWRGSLDVDGKDMLALRNEMTALLQKGLLPSLGVSNVELSVTRPKSQDAYDLYLRSQDSVYWSMARNRDAIALLEKSVVLDPGYAPAWLALGLHYSNEADFASGGEQMHNKTIAALERASQLDSGLLLPSIELIEREAFYGDLSASFARVQEVARRWPRRAEVHLAFSGVLRAAGALEQAARQFHIAVANAFEPADHHSLRFPHAPHFAVATFADHHTEPGMAFAATDHGQFFEPCRPVFKLDTALEPLQGFVRYFAMHTTDVFTLDFRTRMHQGMRECAISGQQQQAGGIYVEPADGDPACAFQARQLLKHGRSAFRIVARGDHTFGLVEHQNLRVLSTIVDSHEELAVQFHAVARAHTRAKQGDGAIDLHLTCFNALFKQAA